MHYRRLGRWGLKLSEISLGGWLTFGDQVDDETAFEIVRTAYELGVNYFDTADANAHGRAEMVLGKALEGLPREALVVASKAYFPSLPGPNGRGLSRKHIIEACNASLKRLNMDYLDIYYCHRYDPDSPYEEVVTAMNTLIQQGKILYWGTSEWRASQIATAHGVARQLHLIPPAVEQTQYNMFTRRQVEYELYPLTQDRGLGLAAWGPLYSGILSGKYNTGIMPGSRASRDEMAWVRVQITPERLAKVRQLTALAKDLGLTTAQLAIAWVLRRKEVSTIITGATSVEQLEENLEAGQAVKNLSEDVLDLIEQILDNLPGDE